MISSELLKSGGGGYIVTNTIWKIEDCMQGNMPQKTETRNIPIVVSEEVTFRITGSLLISEDKK